MNKLPVPTSKPFSPLFVAFTVAVDGASRRNISKSQLSVVVATCVTTSARVVTPYAPTMPEYSIRELTSADLASATVINNANVPAVGAADEAKMAHLCELAEVALAVVDANDVVVGFCVVLPAGTAYESVNYRWFGERFDDFVYLDRVAFAASACNQGLGTRLYGEVERRVSAAQFCCEVNLRPRNDGSLRFHERLGFAEVGQLETDYGVLVSLLAKPLRSAGE